MSAIDNLNNNDKILLQQVAANPAFIKLLELQKEEFEQQLLSFWALEGESALDYRRRHELLAEKYRYMCAQLHFYKNLL